MLRMLVIGFVLAATAPAAALAQDAPPTPRQSAQERCSTLRTDLGAATFNQTYGTNANDRNAFGKCVSGLAADSASGERNAARACKAEQADAGFAAAHAGKTFDQFYGNARGKGAFGKCVSSKAKASADDTDEDTTSAAQLCKAQRTQLGTEAFTLLHGGKANAFGKCVSRLAREHGAHEEEAGTAAAVEAAHRRDQRTTIRAAKACKAELAAGAQAFMTKYGKNATKANAFGKCVAANAKTQ